MKLVSTLFALSTLASPPFALGSALSTEAEALNSFRRGSSRIESAPAGTTEQDQRFRTFYARCDADAYAWRMRNCGYWTGIFWDAYRCVWVVEVR